MINSICRYIEHPELLDEDSLVDIKDMLKSYPYSQSLRLLYLKNLYILEDKNFDDELHKSALYLNDRKVLFSNIKGDQYSNEVVCQNSKKSKDAPVDRTDSLINAFLSSKEEDVEKIKLSMEATSDYASLLIHKDDEEKVEMRGQKLIDDFVEQDIQLDIDKSKEELKPVEENADDLSQEDADITESEYDDDEESYFTETLAKIYVKQGKYSKAIEIIKKLNLKYPKKNVYFADQIRFLEKLIINTKSK